MNTKEPQRKSRLKTFTGGVAIVVGLAFIAALVSIEIQHFSLGVHLLPMLIMLACFCGREIDGSNNLKNRLLFQTAPNKFPCIEE